MSKKPNKRILLILLIAVLLLLILILPGAIQSKEKPQPMATASPAAEQSESSSAAPTEVPATPPTRTQPPNPKITAQTVPLIENKLNFSGALADNISFIEIPDTPLTDLAFQVSLGERKEKIFTLILNSEEGDIVSMIDDPSGTQIPVAFIMDELPPNLSPQEEESFLQAQESVNEIISSIILR